MNYATATALPIQAESNLRTYRSEIPCNATTLSTHDYDAQSKRYCTERLSLNNHETFDLESR